MTKYICAVLLVITACGNAPSLKNTERAAEAMERARAVQAPKYAPKEYNVAKRLFDRMNEEIERKDIESANSTALLVIEAAEEAIRVAQRNRNNIKTERSIKK